MTATVMQEKKNPLTGEQLEDFCGQMAAMLHSGCTPGDSCGALAQDGTDEIAVTAGEMTKLLEEGWPFAYSAEKTGVFPAYALGVFTTAEQSGRLEESLDRLADYYRRQESLQTRMRSALTYPAALLGMMCAVLGVLVFWVLPMFRGVYDSLTGSLAASAYSYVSAAGIIGVVGLVVSGVLLALLRPFLKRYIAPSIQKTNVDSLIGKCCPVTDAICNLESRGQVKIGGMVWSARSESGADIPEGTVVKVRRIEGVKLIVSPVPVPETV